jgi:dihydroorotate dehydrogenase
MHGVDFLNATPWPAAGQAGDAVPGQRHGPPFPNPVGLAAGLDKNGDHIDGLARLGFGFIEIGTITPKPQDGNPKPRLFRIPEAQGIINRMGFNNAGVDHLLENVRAAEFPSGAASSASTSARTRRRRSNTPPTTT